MFVNITIMCPRTQVVREQRSRQYQHQNQYQCGNIVV